MLSLRSIGGNEAFAGSRNFLVLRHIDLLAGSGVLLSRCLGKRSQRKCYHYFVVRVCRAVTKLCRRLSVLGTPKRRRDGVRRDFRPQGRSPDTFAMKACRSPRIRSALLGRLNAGSHHIGPMHDVVGFLSKRLGRGQKHENGKRRASMPKLLVALV